MKKLKAQGRGRVRAAVLKARASPSSGVKKRLREQLMVQRSCAARWPCASRSPSRRSTATSSENREKLETGLTFEARHILFMPEPANGRGRLGGGADQGRRGLRHAARGRGLRRARQEALGGSAPARTAARSGTLKRGELAQEIEDAILRLAPGRGVGAVPLAARLPPLPARVEGRAHGDALAQARSRSATSSSARSTTRGSKEWLAEIKQRAIIEIRM